MDLLEDIRKGNIKSLARCISLVENEAPGFEEMLLNLKASNTPVVGITGPPGSGKSTLSDALIGEMVADGKKVAVICIDPSSPFNKGAILGDRVRMTAWYNNKNVFIRSLASRGSLGGLSSKILEITDLVKQAPFDVIIVETVGVGQSEIEIAGLADVTVVVLVPESGDEIQTMKAGLMEIADIFVVNKSDRPGADHFLKNLKLMLAPVFSKEKDEIPIVATVASKKEHIAALYNALTRQLDNQEKDKDSKIWLLTEKAYQLIQKQKMKNVLKTDIYKKIESNPIQEEFNLYRFVQENY